MNGSVFALGSAVLVCVDGREILGYEPNDESPAWKKAMAQEVTAVAVDGDSVLAVDARGTLVRLAAKDGKELARASFVGRPSAVAALTDGAYAVALEDSIVIVDGDARKTEKLATPWFAVSGTKIAAGTEEGELVVFEREGTAPAVQAKVNGPVRCITAHADGWLVGTDDAIVKVSPEGAVEPFASHGAVALASHASGLVGAVKGDHTAVVLAGAGRDELLHVSCKDRKLVGIAFTEGGGFVWIGLDRGDANKIDLGNEDVYRTDPHPGRERSTWTLDVRLDRSVLARRTAPVAARAPKRETVEEPIEQASPGAPEPTLPESSEADRRFVLTAFGFLVAAAALSLFVGR